MTLDRIDRFEINEAFGAQVMACARELGLDEDKLNVNGGAIAIGHPLGATGIRLSLTLARELQALELALWYRLGLHRRRPGHCAADREYRIQIQRKELTRWKLKGQAAIVTGGASGLGAATARALAAAGAKVAVFDLNEKGAASVAKDIGGIAVGCDVVSAPTAPRPRSPTPPPRMARRAFWSIAPASARPSASSAATARCRWRISSASSAST